MPRKVTDAELDQLVEIFTRTRVLRRGADSQLIDGRYLIHPIARSVKHNEKWAVSIYRNVITPGNDLEIAVDPPPLAWPNDDPRRHLDIWKWLEAQRHLQHLPSGNHAPSQKEHFRIGVKFTGALEFLQLLQQQLSIPQENRRWSVPSLPIQKPSAVEQTIERMLKTVQQTCAQSGQITHSAAKDKLWQFASEDHFRQVLQKLLHATELRCALTGIPLDPNVTEGDLTPSLDRIDSTGHYHPDNVQIVARFANRWKSADTDENFKTLLELIRMHR